MMRASTLRRRWPRLAAWLVAFALVLPLAQLAGAMHVYVHLQQPEAQSADQHAHGAAVCDICLLAAGIGGSAPASPPPAVPLAPLEHAAPTYFPASASFAAPPAAYLSRAPPADLA